ncbi:hypothetical protein DXG01_006959 [Tephrocybe rancida]|nr:hypothetical protein DXG01_006959 [Tephrocybe rancida]
MVEMRTPMQFSMFSLLVKETFFINEVVLGTTFGILMGPHVAGIFDPRSWGANSTFVTREVTRIVLATGLFAIGVELPKSYMAKHAKSLLVMVVPTMAIGWVIVAGVLSGLFPNLTFLSCLAIAACLTPTDPIICAAIVGGKYAKQHVPLNLRQILSAESAANDGLAFPFLTISLYLILDRSKGEAIAHWVLIGWLYQVIMGIAIGAVLGIMFSHLMKFSHRRGYIDHESYVAQYLALAVFITGIMGVGAIFVSSLALHKLPAPQVPPQNEREMLAACLQPIVSFVVLCSIIIHGLSIPFFSLSKNTLTLTNTLTSVTPDWMIGIRHAQTSMQGSPGPGMAPNTPPNELISGSAMDEYSSALEAQEQLQAVPSPTEEPVHPKSVHFPSTQ